LRSTLVVLDFIYETTIVRSLQDSQDSVSHLSKIFGLANAFLRAHATRGEVILVELVDFVLLRFGNS
jgi:hypothetical protein